MIWWITASMNVSENVQYYRLPVYINKSVFIHACCTYRSMCASQQLQRELPPSSKDVWPTGSPVCHSYTFTLLPSSGPLESLLHSSCQSLDISICLGFTYSCLEIYFPFYSFPLSALHIYHLPPSTSVFSIETQPQGVPFEEESEACLKCFRCMCGWSLYIVKHSSSGWGQTVPIEPVLFYFFSGVGLTPCGYKDNYLSYYGIHISYTNVNIELELNLQYRSI